MRRTGLIFILLALILSCIGGTVYAQSGVTVTPTSLLHLRSGPGANFDTLVDVPAGTTLTALARNETADWVQVNYAGHWGWLAVAYLRYKGNIRSLPTGSVAPGAPQPPPDGSIVSLDLYAQTEHVNYYRMTYLSDGLRINGFYAEPRAPGKYPAVIYNRGGNRDVGTLRGFELAPFAESGFVVAASQYRGGGGSEGADQLGGDDVHDVLNLIPLLKSREQVDPDRIAIFGSSRGAMMACIALKTLAQRGSHDIKVASITSSLVDLFMWAKQRSDLDASVYPDLIGATTKSNPAAFQDRSATYWAGLIRVPILIQHGDADGQVSMQQSQTLYRRIIAAGGVARLIILPNGDHGLNNYEAGMPETLKWFQRYLARGDENFDYDFHKDAIYQAYAILRPR